MTNVDDATHTRTQYSGRRPPDGPAETYINSNNCYFLRRV